MSNKFAEKDAWFPEDPKLAALISKLQDKPKHQGPSLLVVVANIAFTVFLCVSAVIYITKYIFLVMYLIHPEQTCVRENCVKELKFLNDFQNQDVKPCDYFYYHACSSWNKLHSEAVYQVNTNKVTAKMVSILKNNSWQADSKTEFESVSSLFARCLEFSSAADDMVNILRFLREIEQVLPLDSHLQNPYQSLLRWAAKYNLFFYFTVTMDQSLTPDISVLHLRINLEHALFGCEWKPNRISSNLNVKVIESVLISLGESKTKARIIAELESIIANAILAENSCLIENTSTNISTNSFAYLTQTKEALSDLVLLLNNTQIHVTSIVDTFLNIFYSWTEENRTIFTRWTAVRAFVPFLFLDVLEAHGPGNKEVHCFLLVRRILGSGLFVSYFLTPNKLRWIKQIDEKVRQAADSYWTTFYCLPESDKNFLKSHISEMKLMLGFSPVGQPPNKNALPNLPAQMKSLYPHFYQLSADSGRIRLTNEHLLHSRFDTRYNKAEHAIHLTLEDLIEPLFIEDGTLAYAMGTLGQTLAAEYALLFLIYREKLSEYAEKLYIELLDKTVKNLTNLQNIKTYKEYFRNELLADLMATQMLYNTLRNTTIKETHKRFTALQIFFLSRCFTYCGWTSLRTQQKGLPYLRCTLPLKIMIEKEFPFGCNWKNDQSWKVQCDKPIKEPLAQTD